jgi:chromosome segregation ATPase
MSDIRKALTREEFNRELVRALDDLVDTARHHGKEIQASLARTDEVFRRRRTQEEERARNAAVNSVVRETPPGYGNSADRLDRVEQRLDRVDQRLDHMDQRLDRMDQRLDRMDQRLDRIEQRLDRIDRTLTDISERMATKVELEATNENVKKMGDGYETFGRRLDSVAELLKVRVVFP